MKIASILAAVLLAESCPTFQDRPRVVRSRKHTKCDDIAFRKRVAKRRAKKGYK